MTVMWFADRCGLAGSPDHHAGPAKSLEAEGNAAASSGGKRSRGKAELTMTTREVRIDRSRPLTVQTETGHNRWHPDIPPVLECDPGHEVILETRDALDGQLTPESTVAQVGQVDLGVVHPLTGPVFVTGAEPGDLLEVGILEVAPEPFGFTCQIPGFGFLADVFTEPHLVRWQIEGGSATSDRTCWRWGSSRSRPSRSASPARSLASGSSPTSSPSRTSSGGRSKEAPRLQIGPAGGGDPRGRARAVRLHLPDPWLRVPRRRLHRAAPRPVADRRRLRDFAGPPRSPRARCAVHGHDRPDPRSRGLAPHTRPGAGRARRWRRGPSPRSRRSGPRHRADRRGSAADDPAPGAGRQRRHQAPRRWHQLVPARGHAGRVVLGR